MKRSIVLILSVAGAIVTSKVLIENVIMHDLRGPEVAELQLAPGAGSSAASTALSRRSRPPGALPASSSEAAPMPCSSPRKPSRFR